MPKKTQKKDINVSIARRLKNAGFRKTVDNPSSKIIVIDDNRQRHRIDVERDPREVLYTSKDVECIVEAYIDELVERMRLGETISIIGFGKFVPRFRPSRTGWNPKTGEKIMTEETFSIKFRPGKRIKLAGKLLANAVRDGSVKMDIKMDNDAEDAQDEPDESDGDTVG